MLREITLPIWSQSCGGCWSLCQASCYAGLMSTCVCADWMFAVGCHGQHLQLLDVTSPTSGCPLEPCLLAVPWWSCPLSPSCRSEPGQGPAPCWNIFQLWQQLSGIGLRSNNAPRGRGKTPAHVSSVFHPVLVAGTGCGAGPSFATHPGVTQQGPTGREQPRGGFTCRIPV